MAINHREEAMKTAPQPTKEELAKAPKCVDCGKPVLSATNHPNLASATIRCYDCGRKRHFDRHAG